MLVHRKGTAHGNADALSRKPCGLECRQCTRHQVAVNTATTRRQAARQKAEIQDLVALASDSNMQSPETGSGENLKEKVPVARRRRRMRGKRHISPLTSTDISDLVPEGRWTPEYLTAMQKADGDLGQLLS